MVSRQRRRARVAPRLVGLALLSLVAMSVPADSEDPLSYKISELVTGDFNVDVVPVEEKLIAPDPTAALAPPPSVLSALFVGNSYTYFFDMPKQLQAALASVGIAFQFAQHTPGGVNFCQHSQNTDLHKLMDASYDLVILQDQSYAPSMEHTRAESLACLKSFFIPELLRKENTNVQLYQTWGRRNGGLFDDFLAMNMALNHGYLIYQGLLQRDSGDKIHVRVSPVGAVFEIVYRSDKDLFRSLYTDDESHPSLKGAYVAAITHAALIAQRSPMELDYTPDGLEEGEAKRLRGYVASVVNRTKIES